GDQPAWRADPRAATGNRHPHARPAGGDRPPLRCRPIGRGGRAGRAATSGDGARIDLPGDWCAAASHEWRREVSLGSAPRHLLGRLLGRDKPAVTRDDPIPGMIARATGRIHPARAYRWRLRGRLVNQYVAVREGLVPLAPSPRAGMGSLGRAVLLASVGRAGSVSAVGAASTSALPGDPLYAVKRQVEELRMEIAPPSVRPALAAMALEERLSEVEQLAAAGRWSRVALGEQEVDGAVATLRGLGASLTSDLVADLTHHAQVLPGLMAQPPAAARPGLEQALLASAG